MVFLKSLIIYKSNINSFSAKRLICFKFCITCIQTKHKIFFLLHIEFYIERNMKITSIQTENPPFANIHVKKAMHAKNYACTY